MSIAGDGETAYVDLARAYFGSVTPIRTHGKPSLVIHACAEEPNSLGVVPLPLIEEPGPAWWAQLAPAGEKGPAHHRQAALRLEATMRPSAYAIGAIEQEPTGDDTTLLLLEIAPGKSRTRLADAAQRGRASRRGSRPPAGPPRRTCPTRFCSK